MQQRTGAFKESFSKNTFYRFLNSDKINWLRFTSLLSATIINEEIEPLTDLLSINVMVGKENPIPAKIVCVRNKANRKDWLAFLCTNPDLSEDEIIRLYGRRWDVEVFFKTCKSLLNLIGECHSLSYDALTAHTAIVFTRYMLLALEQRGNEDLRTLGEIFYYLVNEIADTTFAHTMQILMQAMVASMQEFLKLTEDQIASFMADFASRLPKYLQKALQLTPEVA